MTPAGGDNTSSRDAGEVIGCDVACDAAAAGGGCYVRKGAPHALLWRAGHWGVP